MSALSSALGSFLEKTLHGLEGTWANYSEALSGIRQKLGMTTVFPQVIPDSVFLFESKYFLKLFETLAIVRDSEFMDAIRIGREDIKSGRTHDFSDLLSEYGIE